MKDKAKNRQAGLVFLISLFLVLACGCKRAGDAVETPAGQAGASGQDRTVGSGQTGKPGQAGEARQELTVWTITSNKNDLNSLPGVLEMEARTGIHIEYTVALAGEDAAAEFNLLVAKGEMPDIVYLSMTDGYPGGMERAIEDGVFLDPTDLILSHMPHYRAMVESNAEIAKGVQTEEGRRLLYSISGNDIGPAQEDEWMGLVIRQDWLMELELGLPETIAEWEEALVAFRDRMGAEAPLLLQENGCFTGGAFLSAFGVQPRFYVEGGVVKYGPAEPGYLGYLELMSRWYQEGLLDPNFMTNGTGITVPDELFQSGATGAGEQLWTKTQDYFGGMALRAVPNPVQEAGQRPYGEKIKDGLVNSLIGISASCEDPLLAARWLDFQYSKEGMELNFYGIEGESYEILADGSYELADDILSDPGGAQEALNRYARGNGLGWYNWKILEKYGEQQERMAKSKKTWSGNDLSRSLPYLLDQEGSAGNEAYRIISAMDALATEKTVNYIMGKESLETYGEFQDLLVQYGLAEALQYYQRAYEAYQGR